MIAARGYTGPLYVKWNGSLRVASGKARILKSHGYNNSYCKCAMVLTSESNDASCNYARALTFENLLAVRDFASERQ